MESEVGASFVIPIVLENGEVQFGLAQEIMCSSDGSRDRCLVIPSRSLTLSTSSDIEQIQKEDTDFSYSLITPTRRPSEDEAFQAQAFQAQDGVVAPYNENLRYDSTRTAGGDSSFFIKDDSLPFDIIGYMQLVPEEVAIVETEEQRDSEALSDQMVVTPVHIVQEPPSRDEMKTSCSPNRCNRNRQGRRAVHIGGVSKVLETLAGKICALIQNLCGITEQCSSQNLIEVHHAFFRGRTVAVVALPQIERWIQNTLTILFEASKKKFYGRGRAVCVRFYRESSQKSSKYTCGTSKIRFSCSCWEDDEKRCDHSDELMSFPSVRDYISKFLICASQATEQESTGEKGAKGGWRALSTTVLSGLKYVYWVSYCISPESGEAPLLVPVMQYKADMVQKRNCGARLQCQKCRQSAAKRGNCAHEISVLDALSIPEERKEEFQGGKDLEEEGGEIGEHENVENEEADEYKNKFISTRGRPVIPCNSDLFAIREIFTRILEVKETFSDLQVVLRDAITGCTFCENPQGPNGQHWDFAMSYREVTLHSLGHGSMEVTVTDFTCSKCDRVMYFDGADTGVFAATSKSIYCRDLLDFWLYHTASLGGTFREAYELSKKVPNSSSSCVLRIGNELKTRRRSSSSCFAAFLRTLSAQEGESLAKLFQCGQCQDESGRLCAIVMDGTATGILGKLPQFDRPRVGIPSSRGSSLCQYIIQNAQKRKFLEIFCARAKNPSRDGEFRVNTGRDTAASYERAAESILNASADESQAVVVSEFLQAVFVFPNAKESAKATGSSEENDSTEMLTSEVRATTGVSAKKEFISVIHCLPTREHQNNATDFLRCFTTCSVPATLLRTENTCEHIATLSDKLIKFSMCDTAICHYASQSESNWPCRVCSSSVKQSAKRLNSLCPSASNLAFSLACFAIKRKQSELRGEQLISRNIRTAALRMACVLDEAVQTRKSFYVRFRKGEAAVGKQYNLSHGVDVSGNQSSFGSQESSENGEFFPGRPIIRPRVSFLSSTAQKEPPSDNCTKNYRNAGTHSPGLFTVHCVCPNPKLLGVSVMDASESLSTALSVLLTRFRKLPRTVYYDNACNLSKSIILRSPWVASETRFCCDRFHYRSHTCASVFNPDCYRALDNHRTSGAEAVNSRWATSRSHIRFLDGSNLVPFILAKSVFINLRTMCRESKGVWDVEDIDLMEFGRNLLPCQCYRCNLHNEVNGFFGSHISIQESENSRKKRRRM